MDCLLCYHALLMVFGSIAFCLLWAGYAMPGWLAVTFQEKEARREYTVSSLNRSLWYDVLCPQELYDCKTCKIGDSKECVDDFNFPNYTSHYYWIEALTSDKEQWVLWRVLMTISVICCAIGFILVAFLVCCKLKTKAYRVMATVAFFFWLIPAIFVWIPVAMDADMHEDIKETVNKDIPHDSTLHIPYSVVIVAIGAVVALIVAIMLLWLTGVCSKKKAKDDTDSQSYSENSRTRITGERMVYGPHMYPYYVHDDKPPAYYFYRVYDNKDPYPTRPTEEVVVQNQNYSREPIIVRSPMVQNPDYKQGRIVQSMDDRSGIYSEERWYDNRSNFDLGRK